MSGRAPALALVLACFPVAGCGSSEPAAASSGSAAVPPSGSSVAPAGPPPPKAMCDTSSPEDHTCLEFDDDELIAERKDTCSGRFARNERCPRAGVQGVCLLPEGSRRFGYPPKTQSSHEKRCRELQGRFTVGSEPGAPEPVVVVSCEGRYENACEEEQVHTTARASAANEECRTLGGTFRKGAACAREAARFACDLPGKRTIVSRVTTTVEAAQRFCNERSARYVDLAPPPAETSSSPSASASAPVDLDPPAPKPDVVIRQQ